MTDDLLATVKAALALVYEPQRMGSGVSAEDASVWRRDADGIDRIKQVTWSDLRDLVARCEKAEADLAALRERHAAAVEAAFREGFEAGRDYERDMNSSLSARYCVNENAAWLASSARKAVARDEQ